MPAEAVESASAAEPATSDDASVLALVSDDGTSVLEFVARGSSTVCAPATSIATSVDELCVGELATAKTASVVGAAASEDTLAVELEAGESVLVVESAAMETFCDRVRCEGGRLGGQWLS